MISWNLYLSILFSGPMKVNYTLALYSLQIKDHAKKWGIYKNFIIYKKSNFWQQKINLIREGKKMQRTASQLSISVIRTV